ncbi:hypothetical protein QTP86_029158, partial [Hemibagrus guttatus]
MPEEPEPILPPDLFVCPITWSLDDDIRAATEEEPAPPGGPDVNLLTPQGTVLVAQHGRGCRPLCKRMLSLCHGLHLTSSTR